ncbi:hypothetical protein GCM10023069_32540 [Shinella granuli]
MIAATMPRVDWQDTVRTWLFIGSFLAFGRCRGKAPAIPLSAGRTHGLAHISGRLPLRKPCNGQKLRRLLQGIPPVRDIQCVETAKWGLHGPLHRFRAVTHDPA